MKNEFTLAFNEVLEDKGLPHEVVLGALEAAMVSAYRRSVNASNAQHVEATIDPATGQGRRQVLIMMAYPDILGTSIFDYGGSPRRSGIASVKVQRSVIISSMTYTAELWLWKES